MNFIKRIKLIRIISYILLAISALFVANEKFLIAVLFLIIYLQVVRMHRCPFCKKNIDMRLKIDEMHYCFNCGEKLDIYDE